jgi:hypothetical protein
MTAYTPTQGLPYLTVGQPARDTRAVLQELAEKIDAALSAKAIPPADIAALVAAGWFSDTGWVPMPLPPGFTGPAYVRKVDKWVQLRGRVTGTFPAGAATQIGVGASGTGLPAGYRPAQNAPMPIAYSGNAIGVLSVETDGDIFAIPTGAATWVQLDGISFYTT